MLRCPICQQMNMRSDEERGTCFACGANFSTPQSATAAGTGTGFHLSGMDRLLLQISLAVGIICLLIAGGLSIAGVNYASKSRSTQATVTKRFVSTTGATFKTYSLGETKTFLRGHYESSAVYYVDGKKYEIDSGSLGENERVSVYYQADDPAHAKYVESNPMLSLALLPGCVGLFLMAVGAVGKYLTRPASAPLSADPAIV